MTEPSIFNARAFKAQFKQRARDLGIDPQHGSSVYQVANMQADRNKVDKWKAIGREERQRTLDGKHRQWWRDPVVWLDLHEIDEYQEDSLRIAYVILLYAAILRVPFPRPTELMVFMPMLRTALQREWQLAVQLAVFRGNEQIMLIPLRTKRAERGEPPIWIQVVNRTGQQVWKQTGIAA